MKSSHSGLVLLGLVIGFAASGGVEQQTIAQAPPVSYPCPDCGLLTDSLKQYHFVSADFD